MCLAPSPVFMRCVPMKWYEVRDVAIAFVLAFHALRGERCCETCAAPYTGDRCLFCPASGKEPVGR
jgi:hypothetical protein